LSSSSIVIGLSSPPATTRDFAFLAPAEEILLTLRSGFLALGSFFPGDPSLSESAFTAERVRLRPDVSMGLDEDTDDDFISSVGGDSTCSCGPSIVDMKSRAVVLVSKGSQRGPSANSRFVGEDPSFLPLMLVVGQARLLCTTMLESSSVVQTGKQLHAVCMLTSDESRDALCNPVLPSEA
jgi:hypothetical protein